MFLLILRIGATSNLNNKELKAYPRHYLWSVRYCLRAGASGWRWFAISCWAIDRICRAGVGDKAKRLAVGRAIIGALCHG